MINRVINNNETPDFVSRILNKELHPEFVFLSVEELKNTVIGFVESGMKLTKTAKRMFTHSNTIKHRLTALSYVAQVDMREPENLLAAYYCFKRNQ